MGNEEWGMGNGEWGMLNNDKISIMYCIVQKFVIPLQTK